jgi:hypothetical protein
MVWSGTSVLYLTTLQQLEIMKAFALLSLSITPHHVYLLQIAYSVMTIVISFGTLLEDTIAVFLKPIYPIFVRWGSLGRIIQLSLSLSIITSCSVYMLKLVHHSASIKRLAQLKTINKITLKTIYFLVVQILLDIASSTVFIQSYLIPVKTDIDDRKNNAYKRMASSVMLLRAIFQYVVFLGAVKMTFHKVQKPDQSPEQLLSKTKVINVD